MENDTFQISVLKPDLLDEDELVTGAIILALIAIVSDKYSCTMSSILRVKKYPDGKTYGVCVDIKTDINMDKINNPDGTIIANELKKIKEALFNRMSIELRSIFEFEYSISYEDDDYVVSPKITLN